MVWAMDVAEIFGNMTIGSLFSLAEMLALPAFVLALAAAVRKAVRA